MVVRLKSMTVLLVLCVIIVGLFLVIGYYFFSGIRDADSRVNKHAVVGVVGNERIYKEDISYQHKLFQMDKDDDRKKVVENSLLLQYGGKIGLVSLQADTFNTFNKDFEKRNKSIDKVRKVLDKPAELVSYVVHTMYFTEDSKRDVEKILREYSEVYAKDASDREKLLDLEKEYHQINKVNRPVEISVVFSEKKVFDALSPDLYGAYTILLAEGKSSDIFYVNSLDGSEQSVQAASLITMLSRKLENGRFVRALFDEYRKNIEVQFYEN